MLENQIAINNLSKIYKNGFNALKGVNLNIKKGEIFAMLGPNGCLLYTSPSPRDGLLSRMPSSA